MKLELAVGGGLFADVLVTSAPNQTIHIPGVAKITINKQAVTGKIVISRAHADIACQGGENPPPPPPCQVKDLVTGGGQIGDEDASFA